MKSKRNHVINKKERGTREEKSHEHKSLGILLLSIEQLALYPPPPATQSFYNNPGTPVTNSALGSLFSGLSFKIEGLLTFIPQLP